MGHHKNSRLPFSISAGLTALSLTAFDAAAHDHHNELLFPVDTAIEQRLRSVPGAEPMPYTQILTFSRKSEPACYQNPREMGQNVQIEYYLEVSPKDLGIQPISTFEDNQMRRDSFVNTYGEEMSGRVSAIWERALNQYTGPLMGIAEGDPAFVIPLEKFIEDSFKDFEDQSGITADITIIDVIPSLICADI